MKWKNWGQPWPASGSLLGCPVVTSVSDGADLACEISGTCAPAAAIPSAQVPRRYRQVLTLLLLEMRAEMVAETWALQNDEAIVRSSTKAYYRSLALYQQRTAYKEQPAGQARETVAKAGRPIVENVLPVRLIQQAAAAHMIQRPGQKFRPSV
ncbi:hypothetical protein M440DRAFT_1227675 [Trichoderma longibrachiatum ATCC 18648]|uniref:Uncharacterized protein n=1 Tax=Trichoderma longibrachiatum ATCC 18648 TaxID=983965 RepID=A0A2T4C8M6_TRILO|nr:hypothetical protein M440DRAFT_1227675 [Trichoderma longibrachiatum ATCC 18648]